MKNIFESFQSIILKLEEAKIPYMVVGSVASIIYGEVRMTKDMDLVVDIKAEDSSKFQNIFPSQNFYCPPKEVLNSEIIEQGQFNIVEHSSGLKIDFMLRKNNSHSQIEFQRRKKLPFWKGFEAYVASPEDVILKKLQYYREGLSEKHMTDIKGILSQTEVNDSYLKKWITELYLEKEWALLEKKSKSS